jgi:hypothetical protein
MNATRLSFLLLCVTACVPAEDASPKVYGSVQFDLGVTRTQVTDFADGWTFAVEHLLVAPYCSLPPAPYVPGSDVGYCWNEPDNGDGRTIVDLATGAVFDINKVTNGPCAELSVSLNDFLFVGEAPIVTPGIPSPDVTTFLSTTDMYGGPGVLLVGTARKGALTERVSLGLSQDTSAMSIDCIPTRNGQLVPIDIPNVRQAFHFDFDVERFFPGSPPAFGPVAGADTNPATGNDDGIVTWQELGRAGLDLQIARQLNGVWALRGEDGVCASLGDGGPDGF